MGRKNRDQTRHSAVNQQKQGQQGTVMSNEEINPDEVADTSVSDLSVDAMQSNTDDQEMQGMDTEQEQGINPEESSEMPATDQTMPVQESPGDEPAIESPAPEVTMVTTDVIENKAPETVAAVEEVAEKVVVVFNPDDYEMPVRTLAHMLKGYIDSMAPNVRNSEQEIMRHQIVLSNIISGVLKLQDKKFVDGMNMLVKAVRVYRSTVFSERFLFRGFQNLNMPTATRKRFETILNILLATADVNNPKDITRMVDMKVVARNIPDNEEQQRLISYYI